MRRYLKYIKLLRPLALRETLSQGAKYWQLNATPPADLDDHIAAAYRWLCDAHDAGDDDGVAARYCLASGWLASYPETTGYITATFAAYARLHGDAEALQRATRMARWEAQEQMDSGAVQSGDLSLSPRPAVFNTGQVISGWLSLRPTPCGGEFRGPLERAANWLARAQDADGAWRRGCSVHVPTKVHAYNVRTAWALAQAGDAMGRPDWIAAARAACDWTLRQQRPSGWFDHNSFKRRKQKQPLLHTICYAIEGLWGAGLVLAEERYKAAAVRAVDGLLGSIERFGRISGRYDGDWTPKVRWRCPTGDAQLAGMLLRMQEAVADPALALRTAERLICDLGRMQNLTSRRPGLRGGLPASFPIWGLYGPFTFPNWAVKFYLDAMLLLRDHCDPHALTPPEQKSIGRTPYDNARSA